MRTLSLLPISDGARRRLRERLRRILRPAVLGPLRRLAPLSANWGYDRGTPVDRYYIERFLEEHRRDIRGRVLEIKNRDYTTLYGTGVERSDVLDVDASNPRATIVADLAAADAVPGDSFDCFVLTQTLQYIYDTRAAVAHAHRILRPGGVLLATVPAVSRIDPGAGVEHDYWRFTTAACAALFGGAFGPGRVEVAARGNLFTSVAFLSGMAREELTARELRTDDPYFPLVVTVRAVKG